MKKLWILPALLLLLGGCGQAVSQPQPADRGRLVSFDIYAINDLHGKLADTDTQPGLDELSTYLKDAQRAGNTILLSTGDMWQGASESNLTEGLILTEWMNRMGFAAMTLGGHEFDWGEETIRKNEQLAEFPFLGINIYNRETGTRADYCQSSTVVELESAQIGIIGAIGNCYENTDGIFFKTGGELTALVKAESEKLRSQGVDFIIYAIHDGYDQTFTETATVEDSDLASYYDTVLSEGFVDLVFEADTHYSYVLKDRQGVYHLQAGGNNQGISYARVVLNTADPKSAVVTARLLPNSQYMHMDDDPVVEELLEKYAEQIAPATKPLGINGQYRNNYALSELVAQLYCQKGEEKWGEAYDIVLAGGYISCRSPGYLNPGAVTYSQLQSLLPFDNRIVLCSIRGRDLVSKFLEMDNSAYHIKTTDYGKSIRKNIDPDATYYVVTDSYTADYAYNNMTVMDTYDETTFARDLVAAYITAGSME